MRTALHAPVYDNLSPSTLHANGRFRGDNKAFVEKRTLLFGRS